MMSSKWSVMIFVLLLGFTSVACESSTSLYGHRANDLMKLDPTTPPPLPTKYAPLLPSAPVVLVHLFDYRGGNPLGGYYYRERGLDGPLYQTYSQDQIEYPVFEFFCQALIHQGYRAVKNYWQLDSSHLKPTRIVRGTITQLELDSLHQREGDREVVYRLARIEMEVYLETPPGQIKKPSGPVQVRPTVQPGKKQTQPVQKRSTGGRKKFTISHQFKVRKDATPDVLRSLVFGLVDKFIAREVLPPTGKEGGGDEQ